jgi:hypothetical protein
MKEGRNKGQNNKQTANKRLQQTADKLEWLGAGTFDWHLRPQAHSAIENGMM